MKKILLFCTGVLLLAGCQSPYENAGVGSYGYTYDLNLPAMVGSPGPLHALETTPPGYAAVTPGPAVQTSFGAPAQSVVFYEGSQPAQTVVPGVATTPVWTAPTAVAPGVVPSGAPTVNEAAGAAVGTPAAGAAPQGAVPYGGGGYYGDGGVTIIGSNGLPTSVSNNVFVPTNINITNIVVTNGMSNMSTNMPMTNAFGSTNGSLLSTNFTGGGATNNTAIQGAPVAGATNNLNNLPRADATAAGTAGGTSLVPARPLGSAPTPAQSQAINPPTQPGPTTSTTSGGTTTEAAGAATGTTIVTGGHVPVGSPGAQPTGIGISTSGGTTPSSSAAAAQQRQRVLLQQRAMQQQQQAAPAAPAAAPK